VPDNRVWADVQFDIASKEQSRALEKAWATAKEHHLATKVNSHQVSWKAAQLTLNPLTWDLLRDVLSGVELHSAIVPWPWLGTLNDLRTARSSRYQ